MKKYKWDLRCLKLRKKEMLSSLKNMNLTNDEIAKINYEIENIESMLKKFSFNYLARYPYFLASKIEILEQISSTINKLLSNFQKNTIYETAKYFDDLQVPLVYADTLNLEIPFNKQMDIIDRNFSFNEILNHENKEMFNSGSKRLNIFSKKQINEFFCFDGKGYISNSNSENAKSFLCLCHELGHYHEFLLSTNRIDYNFFIKNQKELFVYREVYSIFYELLSIYFLSKENVLTKNETIELYNYTFQCNTEDITKYILATIINQENNITLSEFLYFKGFDSPLEDIVLYYYSYLIAVNLFEQFLKDEEKALYNLNYLINNITPENEENVLNYIDANPNDLSNVITHTNLFIQKRNN